MSIYYPYRIAVTLLIAAFMGGLCATLGYAAPSSSGKLVCALGFAWTTLAIAVGLAMCWKRKSEDGTRPPIPNARRK